MPEMELPIFNGETWLIDLIHYAMNTDVCLKRGCTTCGAMPFKRALIESANASIGNQSDQEISNEIAKQLRTLPAHLEQSEAIHFIIMFLQARTGPTGFEQDVLPILKGTPSERAYRAMVAHYEGVVARRRAHDLRNDPAEIAQRKRIREKEKQERLAERAIRKKEIDHAWRERSGSPSDASKSKKSDPK